MGTDAADYDGDGRLDLVVTNLDFEMFSLFRGSATGCSRMRLPRAASERHAALRRFGAVFFDFDNDALLDVAFANGHMLDNPAQFRAGASHAQRKLLFRNIGSRRFSDVTSRRRPGFALEKVGRGPGAGDIDNDGDWICSSRTTARRRPAPQRRPGGTRSSSA
jgi:hypothetical protein